MSWIKCRQCRFKLTSCVDVSQKETPIGDSDNNIIPVHLDDIPPWISAVIDSAGWTKGKLNCPQCAAHVGGFDFITGSVASVYLVRSKVDSHKQVGVMIVDHNKIL